jgi:hypothetical protein
LAAELASLLFFKLAVRDDVVEHLTTVYKLKEHVPMMVCPDDVPKATDMWVVEQRDYGSLTGRPNLFRMVGALFISSTCMLAVLP